MPLIVAPVDGYDSLISLADANVYATNHWPVIPVAWSGASDAAKEAALRTATKYVFGRGLLTAYVDPTVHANAAAATVEAALRVLDGTLYQDAADQAVLEKTVGPITVKYDKRANNGQARIPVIDDLLRGLVSTTSGIGLFTRFGDSL